MESAHEDLQALSLALKLEGEGRQFFLAARDRTEHPLAKETFAYLADWELEHISIIQHFYASLRERGQWTSAAHLQGKRGEAIATFRSVFRAARERLDETVSTQADVLEAYRLARDFEDKLIVFYKERAAAASDQTAKQFYTFMTEQEREHHLILENSLRYLDNPAQYHAEEENWMFDGG
ncbi:MAG: ferritin family protein [bacterium]|jgi:rubrerythrin|nr:ferritin family protein [candidate division KSB1 bacterium]MDH7559757.1 ferritin family protein [bacterium]